MGEEANIGESDRRAPSGAHAHAVQFFDEPSFLVQTVARFASEGLRAGAGVVLITTEDHRCQVQRALVDADIDVALHAQAGRLVTLDAADTLAQIMVDGMPNEQRFRHTVGGMLSRLGSGGSGVRAFGEMVALLWQDGNTLAAIQLEQQWNRLQRAQPFSLLCAYPSDAFARASDGRLFRAVCEAHSDVHPAESFVALSTDADRLREIARLQQRSSALAGEAKERRRAQRSVERSARELADFFDNAVVALHLVGPDGTILRANRAELFMLGYTADEYLGRHISDFHVDAATIVDILERLSRGEALHDQPARLRCRDGSIKDVLIDSNALFEGDRFVHSRCFTRDVTAVRRAERERAEWLDALVEARTEAEAASRAKDQFLSVVSHELRTPLAAMLGWVSVLKSGATGDRAARALDSIERSGRAQAKLIDDLLDVARIVNGQMRLDLSEVDFPTVIGQALDAVRPAAEAKGIRLEADIDPTASPVAGDADRLQQVAWNLLSNAVKFTPPGGRVDLRVERTDSAVELTVRDTGRGIAPEFLPFVFQHFRQAESPVSRRAAGLGLGLAIVRHLVELHGGRVAAASDGLDRGSTFTVHLPGPSPGGHPIGPGRP